MQSMLSLVLAALTTVLAFVYKYDNGNDADSLASWIPLVCLGIAFSFWDFKIFLSRHATDATQMSAAVFFPLAWVQLFIPVRHSNK